MKNLDSTLDYMENARFNYVYANIVQRMVKETSFSETEIASLAMIYHKFVLENGPRAKYMSKKQMCDLVENMFNMTDPDIVHGILEKLNKFDPNELDPKFVIDKHVTPIAFIKLFSIFFKPNLEERMEFVFSVYDRKDTGFLDREGVAHAVEKFFSGEDDDEIFELRTDMVDLLFTKFDRDKDNQICFDEYSDTVRTQPDLLEFMGQCLPTRRHLDVISVCMNIVSWYETKMIT